MLKKQNKYSQVFLKEKTQIKKIVKYIKNTKIKYDCILEIGSGYG